MVQERGGGGVPDGHEHTVGGNLGELPAVLMPDRHRFGTGISGAIDAFDLGIQHKGDGAVRFRTLHHDGRGPELGAAMDQGDRGAEPRQEQRLLEGAVAPADDDDGLTAEEEAIAGRAVGDTTAGVFLLAGHPEFPDLGTGGENHRTCLELLALIAHDGFDRALKIDRNDIIPDDRGTEALGLPLHRVHKVGAENAVGESREVLNLRGVDQLTSRGQRARDDGGVESGASQIDGRRVSGRTGTDDDCIQYFTHATTLPDGR